MAITSDRTVELKIVLTHVLHVESGNPLLCPGCEEPPTGVEQTFVAPCGIVVDGGKPYFNSNGTDTEILWNNCEFAKADGMLIFLCPNGEFFTHTDYRNENDLATP